MIKYIAPAPADSNRFGGRESNPTFTLIFSLQLLSVYQFRHLTLYFGSVAQAATSLPSAFIVAGRPRFTAPPFASALAFNSANRICLALFGFTGLP